MNSKTQNIVDPFSPDKKRFLIKSEHFMRYQFAKEYIENNLKIKKPVIYDLGSGTGYGLKILNNNRFRLFGFDILNLYKDSISIDFEKQSILSVIKAYKIPEPDVIVCFETIEHLENPNKLLKEIGDLFPDHGLFICSIPQSKYDFHSKSSRIYHKQQLTIEQIKEVINKSNLKIITIYGQPISNLIIINLKKFSQFLNYLAYSNSLLFKIMRRLFCYPISVFEQYSYSLIFVCKRKK